MNHWFCRNDRIEWVDLPSDSVPDGWTRVCKDDENADYWKRTYEGFFLYLSAEDAMLKLEKAMAGQCDKGCRYGRLVEYSHTTPEYVKRGVKDHY